MILDVFLTVSSTLWMLVVYFIKATAIIGNDEIQKNICTLNENIVITEFQAVCLKYCIWFLVIVLPIIISYLSIRLISKLDKDEINGECLNIEETNNSFLPAYLGYFFVSLSVATLDVMIVIYLMVFVLTMSSQIQYYNPAFLILGYKFYFVVTSNGIRVFLITKRNIRSSKEISFKNLRRINNNSFFELEGND